MLSKPQNSITDKLRQDFALFLIKNFKHAGQATEDSLRLFFKRKDIPKNICGVLNFFGALEDVGEISWTDVSSLKTWLSGDEREVLFDALEAFEIKRNVALLLNAFVKIRKGIPRQNLSKAIEAIAWYLANLYDCESDNLKSEGRSIKKKKTNIEEVMIFLEEKIRKTNLSKPWTYRLERLIVAAGEVLSETETNNEEFEDPLPEDVIRCAAEICSRMTSLEEWVRPIDRRSELKVILISVVIICAPKISHFVTFEKKSTHNSYQYVRGGERPIADETSYNISRLILHYK